MNTTNHHLTPPSSRKIQPTAPWLLPLAIVGLAVALLQPTQAARRHGTEIQGTVQLVNLESKHVTMRTDEGKVVSFRWHDLTKFTSPTPLRKGAHIKVEYFRVLLGEDYVNSVEVLKAK